METIIGLEPRDIQEVARAAWQDWQTGMTTHQDTHSIRQRAAVQQAMELADGEKSWCRDLFAEAAKNRHYSVQQLPLAPCAKRGGSPSRRGKMYAYGLTISGIASENITVTRPRGHVEKPLILGHCILYGLVPGYGQGD